MNRPQEIQRSLNLSRAASQYATSVQLGGEVQDGAWYYELVRCAAELLGLDDVHALAMELAPVYPEPQGRGYTAGAGLLVERGL